MHKVTLGLDPEFFLTENSNIIPACGLIGGSKKEPQPIGSGVTIQEDGVAVEFGMEPVEHEYGSEDFIQKAYAAYVSVSQHIKKIKPVYNLSTRTFWTFNKEALAGKKAAVFGCDPDFNAYQQGDPYVPISVDDFPYDRCTGGHIHVGYPKDLCPIPDYALVQLVEALSLYFNVGRKSQEYIGIGRHRMYGRPGAFRPKPYGFEYRTPSAIWVTEVDTMPSVIGSVVKWAINNLNDARLLYDQIPFMSIYEELKALTASRENLQLMDNLYNKYVRPAIKSAKEDSSVKVELPIPRRGALERQNGLAGILRRDEGLAQQLDVNFINRQAAGFDQMVGGPAARVAEVIFGGNRQR